MKLAIPNLIALAALSDAVALETKRHFERGVEAEAVQKVCDMAPPYFELLFRKNRDAPLPRFRESAKKPEIKDRDGLVIVYSDQCPFTALYVKEMAAAAERCGVRAKAIRLATAEEARDAPSAFGTFSVFLDGKFLTYEIMSGEKSGKSPERGLMPQAGEAVSLATLRPQIMPNSG